MIDGWGAGRPYAMPSTNAADFEKATALLQRYFGYEAFRPQQASVVRAVLARRDVLGVLPTGAGKSVCFQIPALLTDGVTIVVTPLISLMEDQVANALRHRITAAALHAAQADAVRRETRSRVMAGSLKLLYVSPERLDTRALLSMLSGVEVARLAVDEAHCVSEWGHDFRPAYRRIADFRSLIGWPPCVALTATATPATRSDVVTNLKLRRPAIRVWPADRPNLRWEVRRARSTAAAAEMLIGATRSASGAAILYVRTRSAAVRMADALRRSGMVAAAYHAGMDATSRREVQDAFVGGRLGAVCATTAFGMGIDHPSVRFVGHLGRPDSLEAYIQEAGRAGRDGAPARCLLMARGDDDGFHAALHARSWPSRSLVRAVWRAMPAGRPSEGAELAAAVDGRSTERVRDALVFLERTGAARRRPSAESAESGVCGDLWVRGPQALWPKLEVALQRGRRRARDRLAEMGRYISASGCRRHVIARYFGDAPPRCRGCDGCDASRL